MNKISRRLLAKFAVDHLLAGVAPGELWYQLAAVLTLSNRTSEATLLADDISWELESRGKLAVAKLTTAHKINQNLRSELLSEIKQAASVDTVDLVEIIEPKVIGGFKVETAIHSWDETVVKRLNDLRGVASA